MVFRYTIRCFLKRVSVLIKSKHIFIEYNLFHVLEQISSTYNSAKKRTCLKANTCLTFILCLLLIVYVQKNFFFCMALNITTIYLCIKVKVPTCELCLQHCVHFFMTKIIIIIISRIICTQKYIESIQQIEVSKEVL